MLIKYIFKRFNLIPTKLNNKMFYVEIDLFFCIVNLISY